MLTKQQIEDVRKMIFDNVVMMPYDQSQVNETCDLAIRGLELEEFRKFVEKSGMGAGCNEDTCHHYSCHICLIDKARALGQKEGG